MKRRGTQSGSRDLDCSPSPNPHSTGYHSTTRKTPGAAIFYLVGFLGGMMGGLLGIGGGSVIAPFLLVTGTLRPAQVSGTTLSTVLLVSMVGTGAYASLGNLNLDLAWPIATGSVAGAVLGALTAKRVSMRLMIVMFLVILPYFAAKVLWPSFAGPTISTSLLSLGSLGFATGFLSGILGISGASLVVPSLVGFFLFDHHTAQGIAISVAMADSAAGAATHARWGNVNYRVVSCLAIPAVAAGGAFLSDSLPSSALRNLFLLFMVATWGILLVRLIKDYLRAVAASPEH